MRRDEIDTFIIIATGGPARWMPDHRFVYHATPDSVHALCRPQLGVSENYRPSVKTDDRSNDLMTCATCAEMVRRRRVRAS